MRRTFSRRTTFYGPFATLWWQAMSKTSPTSVKLEEWPVLDRELWHAATHKGDFLDPDGKAANWSDATRIQVEKGYGKWIFHLDGRRRSSSSRSTAAY